MEIYTVAFFGHSYITDLKKAEERLEERVRSLIEEKGFVEFLVGKNGDFDRLAASAVKRIKRTYRSDNSALVLVLPYNISDVSKNTADYERYYDEIEISATAAEAHPKAAITVRNSEMAERADEIICYVERKSGGAYRAVEYAKGLKKRVTNVFDGTVLDFE